MAQQNIETPSPVQQSAEQESQTALQRASDSTAMQPTVTPNYPSWPTSKRGPRVTPPPPGMLPTHRFRTEQVTEIGYNQETGEPADESPERALPDEAKTGSVSFDLKPKTGQESLGKRKQRL